MNSISFQFEYVKNGEHMEIDRFVWILENKSEDSFPPAISEGKASQLIAIARIFNTKQTLKFNNHRRFDSMNDWMIWETSEIYARPNDVFRFKWMHFNGHENHTIV